MTAPVQDPGAVCIGHISGAGLDALTAWARSVPLVRAVHSAYAPDRLEAWFRRAVHLGNSQIERHPDPPERVLALCDRLLPGWHSALLCGGDTTIKPHRDAPAFEAHAILINIGAATFTYYPDQRIGTRAVEVPLVDGGVYKLNIKVLHQARPDSIRRMSLTLRMIKADVLARGHNLLDSFSAAGQGDR